MGLGLDQDLKFDLKRLKDRDLMLRMLKAEDRVYFSALGQEHIKAHGGGTSVESGKVIQREILQRFGFKGSVEDVAMYRSVIHHYYQSPVDYDKEIMDSVVYLRENKLLYYTQPKLQVGDQYVDVELRTLNNKRVRISELFEGQKDLIIAAFSLS